MKDIFFNFQGKILCLFMIIIFINTSFSYVEFTYPYAIKLNSTNNIFVIHKYGIDICDENFTEIIRTVETFSASEILGTDAALSKVTSVIGEEYIICIINDKIYLFDEEGNLLQKNSNTISNLNVDSYSLVYLGKTVEKYPLFSIAFISSKKLYINSYKINFVNGRVTNLFKLEKVNNYTIQNSDLSCHYPYYSSYSYFVIACFYSGMRNGNYIIAINFFDVSDTIFRMCKYKDPTYKTISKAAKYIKSALYEEDYENILVGWIASDGIPYHWRYNINEDVNKYSVSYLQDSKCILKKYGFKYDYYLEKSDFIFTCLLESNSWTVPNANILVEFLNENGIRKNYTYKYKECDIQTYSIIYLNNKKDYYIISDASCPNDDYPYNLLFGDLKKEEEKKEEEEEKEEEKKEEEKEEEEEEEKEEEKKEEKKEEEKQPEEEHLEEFEKEEEKIKPLFEEENYIREEEK